jgi:formylglycine-generating enzyme required for sulfatase activity
MKLPVLLAWLSAVTIAFAQTKKSKVFTNATGMIMVRAGANYWISKHLVTQAVYQKVMGSNPSKFHGQNHPVDSVSWNNAVAFCARLTETEREKGYLPERCAYTLPTQAQWEAMAAGTSLAQAVTSEKSNRTSTSPVGSLAGTGLGLHDVRGNLWQWCLDPQDQAYRVLRGAAWNTSIEVNLRPEFRWYSKPDEAKEIFGFRCVLQETP